MRRRDAETSDEFLLRQTAAGDLHSFRQLVDRHKAYGMTLATRVLQDKRLAEEGLQDAFLRVFRSAKSFEGKSKFTTWFYRILYNVCVTKLKSLPPESEALDEAEWSYTAEEFNETELLLMEAIERLPERYRAVVTLSYLQEMSYEEIVATCGMPLGTVKTILHRSRELLKRSRALREHLGLEGNLERSKG